MSYRHPCPFYFIILNFAGKLWLRGPPSWPSELQTLTPGSAQRRTNKYPVIDCNFSPSNKPFHKQKLTPVSFSDRRKRSLKMSLVVPPNFQHILRVLNTNIDGKTSIMFAMTSIKGIGRRYANICLKKADIPLNRRAGELSEEEVERLITIVQVRSCCVLL